MASLKLASDRIWNGLFIVSLRNSEGEDACLLAVILDISDLLKAYETD